MKKKREQYNMSEQLTNKVNNTNYKLVRELVEIINDRKIKNIDQLVEYEDKIFTINGYKLNDDERVEYCTKMYMEFPFEYDDLTFDELQTERMLYNKLKVPIENKEKIKILIILFSLTGRQLFFLKETYEMIMNNEI